MSLRAALAWMKRLLDDPKTSDVEREHLRDAVNQLNKLLAAPHPARAGNHPATYGCFRLPTTAFSPKPSPEASCLVGRKDCGHDLEPMTPVG